MSRPLTILAGGVGLALLIALAISPSFTIGFGFALVLVTVGAGGAVLAIAARRAALRDRALALEGAVRPDTPLQTPPQIDDAPEADRG